MNGFLFIVFSIFFCSLLKGQHFSSSGIFAAIQQYLPIILPILLFLLVGCFVGIFFWNRTLNLKVRTRTFELEKKAKEIEELNAQLAISNEELQTSKEELESANEELNVLNEDLEKRYQELSQINQELNRLKIFNESVIATAPSILIVVDAKMRVISANVRYYESWFAKEGKVEGDLLGNILPAGLLQNDFLLQNVKKVFETSSPIDQSDVVCRDENLNEYFYNINISPLKQLEGDESQQGKRCLLTIYDVTEKKRLELTIEKQKQYLANLINNSIVSIATVDKDSNVVVFNEAAETLTGHKAGEVIGRSMGKIWNNLNDYKKIVDAAYAKKRIENFESALKSKEGGVIPVNVFAAHIEGERGETVGILIICIDIRKQKKVEQNLVQRNRELSTLYNISQTLNQSLKMEKILDQTLEKVGETFDVEICSVGTTDEDKKKIEMVISKGDPQFVKNRAVQRTFCEDLSAIVVENPEPLFIENLLEDARFSKAVLDLKINGSCLCVPLMTREEMLGVLEVISLKFHKFTPQDSELLSSIGNHIAIAIKNINLYEDLRKAYVELQQTQDQLIRTEKFRALGELSAGVAHDFNNVLGIILGRAQHLMDLTEDEEILEGLEAIEQASRDAASTVDRIQNYSSLKTYEEYPIVDVNNIVREVVNMTKTRWKQNVELKGIDVKLNMNLNEVGPISGDTNELREALTNIILNALDAMPKGGQLDITTGSSDFQTYIKTRDTGVGMDEEAKSKIFDPFFTTKGGEGTGLGMSVVYGIIKRHNGKIEVESAVGEGTTVTLMFPINLRAKPVEEPVPVKSYKKAKILIIDDNLELSRTISNILVREHHKVAYATDGKEGLENFKKNKYDIVFTDIGMPGMSGWEISKSIKKMRPDTDVVFITGWGTQVDKKKMKACGSDLILSKPFDKRKILSIINKIMESRG